MNEVVVQYIGAQGDGVAPRPPGKPLFVKGAAPGDIARLDDTGLVAELVPGPNRAEPVCRHFGVCGGCTLQHVAEPAYRAWLADRILMALAQHEVTPAQVEPVHLSPPGSRRRASLRAVRRGRRVEIGFNIERTHRLVDLVECPVLHPALLAALTPLRDFLRTLLADGHAATVQLTLTDAGLDVTLAGLKVRGFEQEEACAAFAEAADLARLSIEGASGLDVMLERRPPTLRFGGVPVRLPYNVFLQATADGEAALVDAVLEAVGAAAQVADLFAGVGTFALPLSRTARVLAADAAQPAMQALDRAAREAGRPVTVAHRDLFRRPMTPAELKDMQAVVFDPPRAGAEAQVEMLAQSDVPVVVAVSCNPNTFARDARLLADGGYRLERLWPVGQFLWSTHVELVARFARG